MEAIWFYGQLNKDIMQDGSFLDVQIIRDADTSEILRKMNGNKRESVNAAKNAPIIRAAVIQLDQSPRACVFSLLSLKARGGWFKI